MGTIRVHEFTTLDGVIDAPTWTFDYPFDAKMGELKGQANLKGFRALLTDSAAEQLRQGATATTVFAAVLGLVAVLRYSFGRRGTPATYCTAPWTAWSRSGRS